MRANSKCKGTRVWLRLLARCGPLGYATSPPVTIITPLWRSQRTSSSILRRPKSETCPGRRGPSCCGEGDRPRAEAAARVNKWASLQPDLAPPFPDLRPGWSHRSSPPLNSPVPLHSIYNWLGLPLPATLGPLSCCGSGKRLPQLGDNTEVRSHVF